MHDQRKKSKPSTKTNNVEKYQVLLVVSVIRRGACVATTQIVDAFIFPRIPLDLIVKIQTTSKMNQEKRDEV